MDVWLRVLVGAIIAVAPSVLFVLFYRGLVRLQDQELIDRIAETGGFDLSPAEFAPRSRPRRNRRSGRGRNGRSDDRSRSRLAGNRVTGRRAALLRDRIQADRGRSSGPGPSNARAGSEAAVVRCPTCGTENDPIYRICENCLERVG